ncbi:MAG: efflux RND transporter periplasmic adaptor subunit [Bacteroidetes bacterium]|nr:efflux RND transporter periplasmic adaptor subunit [Bacteroidota bacterium]MCK4289068.1 efflux RND transporter periplasmic adaptor subunit [Bacteroidales bacterium]
MKKIHYFIRRFILIAVVVFTFFACKNEQQAPPPPPEIPVVEVIQKDVPIYQEFVGQVYGLYDIPIRARVEGWLEGIYFKEGSPVCKGQHLYSIDPETYEARVAEKESALAEAETNLVKAQNDLRRIKPLAEMNAVSQSDLDAALANEGACEASVKAAKANLRAANIELSYTNVKSPIDGIIGKTKAKVGEFVGKDPNPVILNVVSTIDTIRVQFFLAENYYLAYARGAARIDSLKNGRQARQELEYGERNLELILSDNSVFKFKGKVDFIDRQVDPTTGCILLQASFPNPEKILRPGQFARIKGLIYIEDNALLVPQRCLSELQGKYSLYVVNDSSKIERRDVETGSTIDSFWVITKGVSQGEKVVYEGIQQVGEGMTVSPEVIELDEKGQKK